MDRLREDAKLDTPPIPRVVKYKAPLPPAMVCRSVRCKMEMKIEDVNFDQSSQTWVLYGANTNTNTNTLEFRS